jgi:peptidoglycan lytic transglycosylase G
MSRVAMRAEAKAAKKLRRRRWRALVLVLVLAGAVVVVVTNALHLPLLGADERVAPGQPARVTIQPGASTKEIGVLLEKAGVVEHAAAFRSEASERGVADKLKPGDYLLSTGMPSDRLFEILTAGPESTADRITFPEGLTIRQITDRMVAGGRWTRAQVNAALADPALSSPHRPKGKPLEGLLFPATYALEPGEKPVEVLGDMLDELDQVLAGQDLAAAKRLRLSPYEILVVASLVEREAKVPVDRPKVARVIYNRLKVGQPLQIDAAILYALRTTKVRLSTADLRLDSPYNTYTRKGLPPTPIAAPGEASIRAALDPASGPWLYYVVTSKDGGHSFTASYQEFLRLKQRAQAAGLA